MDSPVANSTGAMPGPSGEAPEVQEPPENPLLLADEQKLVEIEKPHHNDVLCGRGVTTNRHSGNESFRSLVGLNKELYVSSTKRQKMGISRSIVQAVRSLDPPGRFLDKDAITGLWHDIGHKKAVEKTSQALRDGAAMLRKQLSADLGDPNFLNAVFGDDGNKTKDVDTKKEKTITIKTSGKENNKESKGNSPEKVKVIKAKPPHGKKGHRRVSSNPLALTAVASKTKISKRYRTQDEPRTPGPDYRWNYHQCPPSPRSPGYPGPHARSLPSSPMPSWGGGPPPSPYSERHGYYSNHHHQSPYSHAPRSPYPEHSDPGRHRSHSFERYHGPPGPEQGLPPRHHSWSTHDSAPRHPGYHHRYSHPHYHHYPPSPAHHPQSPVPVGSPPPPPTPSGPLPPGRHTYSPREYYPGPPPTLPEPREPWSPRRGYLPSYEAHGSPQPYYSPRHGDPRPERAASWTPRSASPHHREYYYDHDHSDSQESSGSLSVPSLGGEGRPASERFSPKLHLAPRSCSQRQMVRESGIPPRPPPNYGREDFRPPMSPTKYHRSREDSRYYRRTTVEEEKKTSDMGDRIIRPSGDPSNSAVSKQEEASTPEPMETESRSSPDQERIDRGCVGEKIEADRPMESRTSPGGFVPIKEDDAVMEIQGINSDDDDDNDDDSEAAQAVDDIAMSPIPYDREDPATLLDLPDDILALPISACDPHDNPVLS